MKTMTMEALAEATIPVTIRQAFRILDEMVSEEDTRSFLSQTKAEFVTDQHFGLGLWIRNSWIYGSESEDDCFESRRRACIAMLSGKKEEEIWIGIPDMISSDFLKKYYDHLRRTRKQK